jgi:hypothetical protein
VGRDVDEWFLMDDSNLIVRTYLSLFLANSRGGRRLNLVLNYENK